MLGIGRTTTIATPQYLAPCLKTSNQKRNNFLQGIHTWAILQQLLFGINRILDNLMELFWDAHISGQNDEVLK